MLETIGTESNMSLCHHMQAFSATSWFHLAGLCVKARLCEWLPSAKTVGFRCARVQIACPAKQIGYRVLLHTSGSCRPKRARISHKNKASKLSSAQTKWCIPTGATLQRREAPCEILTSGGAICHLSFTSNSWWASEMSVFCRRKCMCVRFSWFRVLTHWFLSDFSVHQILLCIGVAYLQCEAERCAPFQVLINERWGVRNIICIK